MNTYIETNIVDAELKKIDGFIDQLNQLCESVDPNIKAGWNSPTAREVITPKIEKIKNSINSISTAVLSVRNGVSNFSANMQQVDTAGTAGATQNSIGGGGSIGSNYNMLK